MDLSLEVPRSRLDAVMSAEVWEEYYTRLAELIAEHRTTLVFVNTRKMAERVARHLSERLGEEAVTAHHGSLSKEKRLDAETRLKTGQLKALVATASLELGIDIGSVDLVCQIGSPHRIATLLQRVGRSGHSVSGLPKGRVFPASRDDLVECAALLRAVKRGELDRIVVHDAPLDVLAQQIVAETSCRDYSEDELYAMVRRAWPYRDLDRRDFGEVLRMVAEGFSTKRGRRGALVHRDEVNGNVRGRRGSRMLALTSGGAIPEVADYRVVLEPEETFIGTLDEDFAIESNIGDVFQLGNMSWRVLQVSTGVVRVADAHGAPPSIPFWLGEAPARSDELSEAVSALREELAKGFGRQASGESRPYDAPPQTPDARRQSVAWLVSECGIPQPAADEITDYLDEAIKSLGVLPTQNTLVLERFFDESGGMQLVLHAPFGSRINRAWGLALRKRFCRQFDFELQAAATEDAILLSLGPQHSFPLADVFRYLHPATAREVLVQAFLDAPVWQTRWRWNTTVALAVPRSRNGKKVPPQLQRMLADDLMAAVFPDAAACFENIGGDRQIPDHPLVNQAVRDCLEEAMDFEGLAKVLTRIHAGEIELVARDTVEPSPLSHGILNAAPYAFLDDAPLEERRTQAVYTRRAGDVNGANELGALDPAAIARVRDEERPDPRDADELHDALVTAGFLTADEAASIDRALFETLAASRRAALVRVIPSEVEGSPSDLQQRSPWAGDPSTSLGVTLWIAAERLPELQAIHTVQTNLAAPASRNRAWTREEALVELIRGRMTITGPIAADALARSLGVENVDAALLALENEGTILRGAFTGPNEWCDRRLLARIHRYTIVRLRAEIEPVNAAAFQRFLFVWQHVAPSAHLSGIEGLQALIGQLDGYEVAASAWEKHVLPSRMDRYDPPLLDMLCLGGEVGWARLSSAASTTVVSASPIAIFLRDHAEVWRSLRGESPVTLSAEAQRILDLLRARGASFLRDLGTTEAAIGELVSAGLIASDAFAGLRALIGSTGRGPSFSGRWSVFGGAAAASAAEREQAVEIQARTFLRRYGIVFRRLLAREPNAAPWRELSHVYRRLEARGEVRGGRFVHGMSGEQFALPEAVERMREIRRAQPDGALLVISAADPLNLSGILDSGERIRAAAGTRIAYRDGVAVSVMEGDYLRPLDETGAVAEVATALAGRRVAATSGWVGR